MRPVFNCSKEVQNSPTLPAFLSATTAHRPRAVQRRRRLAAQGDGETGDSPASLPTQTWSWAVTTTSPRTDLKPEPARRSPMPLV